MIILLLVGNNTEVKTVEIIMIESIKREPISKRIVSELGIICQAEIGKILIISRHENIECQRLPEDSKFISLATIPTSGYLDGLTAQVSRILAHVSDFKRRIVAQDFAEIDRLNRFVEKMITQ